LREDLLWHPVLGGEDCLLALTGGLPKLAADPALPLLLLLPDSLGFTGEAREVELVALAVAGALAWGAKLLGGTGGADIHSKTAALLRLIQGSKLRFTLRCAALSPAAQPAKQANGPVCHPSPTQPAKERHETAAAASGIRRARSPKFRLRTGMLNVSGFRGMGAWQAITSKRESWIVVASTAPGDELGGGSKGIGGNST